MGVATSREAFQVESPDKRRRMTTGSAPQFLDNQKTKQSESLTTQEKKKKMRRGSLSALGYHSIMSHKNTASDYISPYDVRQLMEKEINHNDHHSDNVSQITDFVETKEKTIANLRTTNSDSAPEHDMASHLHDIKALTSQLGRRLSWNQIREPIPKPFKQRSATVTASVFNSVDLNESPKSEPQNLENDTSVVPQKEIHTSQDYTLSKNRSHTICASELVTPKKEKRSLQAQLSSSSDDSGIYTSNRNTPRLSVDEGRHAQSGRSSQGTHKNVPGVNEHPQQEHNKKKLFSRKRLARMRSKSLSYLFGGEKPAAPLFGGSYLNREWEIVTVQEMCRRLSLEHIDQVEMPIPEGANSSQILDELMIRQVMEILPARAEGYPWVPIYSSEKHGFSLSTLYRKMAEFDEDMSPVLLIIRDTNEHVFGAIVSGAIRPQEGYFGTGDSCLLWRFTGEVPHTRELRNYTWTGENQFFVSASKQCLAIGGGSGHIGIWLDADLNHGRSQKCNTFDNEPLSGEKEDFIIQFIEAFGFRM